MEIKERNAVFALEIGVWAKEAVCCPVCKVPWTVETIKDRQPRIANADPRLLVCHACWVPWLEICRTNVDNARRSGQST